MKTRRSIPRPGRNLKGLLASIAVSLLLVVGLFLASVLLTPLDAPVPALHAPAAAASQAPSSSGVTGTLASFTALFPEMVNVYLPAVER